MSTLDRAAHVFPALVKQPLPLDLSYALTFSFREYMTCLNRIAARIHRSAIRSKHVFWRHREQTIKAVADLLLRTGKHRLTCLARKEYLMQKAYDNKLFWLNWSC